jgi:atypical dual specificity phosphatase
LSAELLIGSLTRLPRQLWAYARLKRLSWLEQDRLVACRYPRDDTALRELAELGVTLLINLHERPHAPEALARHGLTQMHLAVRDFAPPTLEQLERGVAAIEHAIADGHTVAVHCGAGLGRTGTLLACYLVSGGLDADEALASVRRARPGSVETVEQELAVRSFARRPGDR